MSKLRTNARYRVVLKVRYDTAEALQEALLRNLGMGGLYIATPDPFDVGYRFEVEIELPEDIDRIKGTGEVVWVNQIDSEDYPKGMGVRFVEIEEASRQILEAYLGDAYKTGGPH